MHPRNRYATPPDWRALGARHARLAPHVSERNGIASVAWDVPEARRAATEALLADDWGLDVRLCPDRLCPTLPNRLNYVLWIEDLVHALHPVDCVDRASARGIDVGTGSIAVYALLACTRNPHWTMVGTEVDTEALEHAKKTIAHAAHAAKAHSGEASSVATLPARIQLVHTDTGLLDALDLDANASVEATAPPRFQFVLCNPPFYASEAERQASSDAKRTPREWAEGRAREMYTPGGDLAFALQLLEESRRYTHQIAYVSSLMQLVLDDARQAGLADRPRARAARRRYSQCRTHRARPRRDEALGRCMVVPWKPCSGRGSTRRSSACSAV